MKDINIDKMTSDLMKKGLQRPESDQFDDELMKKILALPKPQAVQYNSKLMKNGWRFLLLSLFLLLVSISIISTLIPGYETELSKAFMAAKMYILYGGMALFTPLIFMQLDSLLKMKFRYQLWASVVQ